MRTSPLIIATAGILLLGTLYAVLLIIRARLRKNGLLSHSLGLGLLKIALPKPEKTDDEKVGIQDVREKIALMEQVYSQLGTIKEGGLHAWLYGKPFFSLEVVVPHVGQEVIFYLGVPRRYQSSAEKLIQGVYQDAQIEAVKDYTIFTPQSAAAAAIVKGRNKFLPLKTYQQLDADPLGSILNAFSKVSHDKEGLALQIIGIRAGREYNSKIGKVAKHLRDGKSVSKALSEATKSAAVEALSVYSKTDSEKNQTADKRNLVNDALTQLVEKKASKMLFEANIRLVASAPDQERANSLLQELITPMEQFTNEETNSFVIEKQKGRSLQKTIYQYAFRIPDRGNRIVLSTEELASCVHLPNTVIGSHHIASIKAKAAAPPQNLPRNGLLLGANVFRGTETNIFMTPEDRARHFYIIGQTGTGKTYFMRNMIVQDIEAGHGVCFIDPHGDMAEDILGCIPPNRIKDVIYFNPGDVSRPMGLNMLEYDPRFPEQKTFIINELLEIFNKLYDMKTAGGPMFEQYFRNATALVMDDPESGNTLLEINRVFVDKKFRDYKLSRTTNPLVKTFWRDIAEKAGGDASLQNIVPYISSKFDSFLSNEIMRPIVSQEHSAFRLREVMDTNKILLINLSKGRLGELNSSLIGLIMVGKMLMAAFSRVDTPEAQRKNFYLYADEFQNVSTNSIETILSEARKYKLNLIIAHQFIGQLEDEIKDAVFGNVGSMAAFRVGPEDAEFLEKQFSPIFNRTDLINIDNRNCYVRMLINGQTAPAFSMKTLKGKPSDAHLAESAKEFSRMMYGRDRKVVEEEMMVKFAALDKRGAIPTNPLS